MLLDEDVRVFRYWERGGKGFNDVVAYFVYILGLCPVRLNRGR